MVRLAVASQSQAHMPPSPTLALLASPLHAPCCDLWGARARGGRASAGSPQISARGPVHARSWAGPLCASVLPGPPTHGTETPGNPRAYSATLRDWEAPVAHTHTHTCTLARTIRALNDARRAEPPLQGASKLMLPVYAVMTNDLRQLSHAKSTKRCAVARTPGDGPHATTYPHVFRRNFVQPCMRAHRRRAVTVWPSPESTRCGGAVRTYGW